MADQTTTAARKRKQETSPRDAQASRSRIFDAAKLRFSQSTYEGVGVRDIASDAGVDAALVIRYFGSKEGLFKEIAAQAFGTAEFLKDGVEGLPQNAADILMAEMDGSAWRSGYDPLRLLLASIGSPVAGPILAQYLDADFVRPLTEAIGGMHGAERGTMVAAWIIGFALMRISGPACHDTKFRRDTLRRIFVATLDSTMKFD
ncbi:TetR/AcrR family transcriptional regulator [Rhizobium sp. P38BS-XIX]|uniref:TetR/AcrR family transcriptional regulator n=1 Tax=Rhizobium sp. P38BS-XIX TaxID=2726740 RepID=UPI001456A909|nr:TetR/AcrR family transcriptional regulator [Rhizobium sp. P38BS-XIX]NLR97174.1 TetR/AcrR family transcriptional regulator [Rhizobium sp. P38BS-XIX]